MDKKVIQIQLAYFFKEDYKGDFEKVSLALKKRATASSAILLPIPPEAPGEIPRLNLEFTDYKVNVAKNRLDVFARNIEIINKAVLVMDDETFNELGIKIARIGFVKSIFAPEKIETAMTMLNAKFNSLKLKDISVRVNKQTKIADHECNDIEQISNGLYGEKDANGQKVKTEGLVIFRDINIISNDSPIANKERETIIKFFDSESENIILL